MVPLDVLIVHQFLPSILHACLLFTRLSLILHGDNLDSGHRGGFFARKLILLEPMDFIFAWEGLGAHFVDHAHTEMVTRCRLPTQGYDIGPYIRFRLIITYLLTIGFGVLSTC